MNFMSHEEASTMQVETSKRAAHTREEHEEITRSSLIADYFFFCKVLKTEIAFKVSDTFRAADLLRALQTKLPKNKTTDDR
jgi:hypothetical protein